MLSAPPSAIDSMWIAINCALCRVIPENWLVLFTHDHETSMGRIGINEKGKPVLIGTK
jgi:hypothetical protein